VDGLIGNESFSTTFKQGLLDRNQFRVEMAMGVKSRNLVNRAYRSTNRENVDFYKDVLSRIPTCSSVKLS